MIIVMSGVDGAGKSTQINLISAYCKELNYRVKVLWARGGYTPLFKILKRILRVSAKGKTGSSIYVGSSRVKILKNKYVSWLWLNVATLDLILFYAIYARFLSACGLVVICDRFIEDTFLDFTLNFQESFNPDGILWRILRKISPKPSNSFLLLVPVDVSIYRSKLKNDPFPDSNEVLEWRYSKYNDSSLFSGDRYTLIDATMSIEDVKNNILSELLMKR